jgi:hypothetical protein
VLAPDQILIFREIGVVGFEVGELVSEEAHVSFVIIEQEEHHPLLLYQALQLGPLIGGQSNGVVVVFIHYLHPIVDPGTHVQVDQFSLLEMEVVSDVEASLNFEPVLQGDLVEYLVDQFKASHLVP